MRTPPVRAENKPIHKSNEISLSLSSAEEIYVQEKILSLLQTPPRRGSKSMYNTRTCRAREKFSSAADELSLCEFIEGLERPSSYSSPFPGPALSGRLLHRERGLRQPQRFSKRPPSLSNIQPRVGEAFFINCVLLRGCFVVILMKWHSVKAHFAKTALYIYT